MKSLEQKLYEAYQGEMGLTLGAKDIRRLIADNDELKGIITHAAEKEAGVEPSGADQTARPSAGETWGQFKRRLQEEQE